MLIEAACARPESTLRGFVSVTSSSEANASFRLMSSQESLGPSSARLELEAHDEVERKTIELAKELEQLAAGGVELTYWDGSAWKGGS